MMVFANIDIYSSIHRGGKLVLYARKMELLKVISDRGNVLIVEGASGRFPVNKKLITETK